MTPGRLLAIAFLGASLLGAHDIRQSILYLNVEPDGLRGRVEATLRDLGDVLPLDADSNGETTAAELEAQYDTTLDYIRGQFALGAEGRDYVLEFDELTYLDTKAGVFAQFNFHAIDVTDVPDMLEVEFRLMLNEIPGQLGYLALESNHKIGLTSNESAVSLIFDTESGREELDLTLPVILPTFGAFVEQGIKHIWIGIDHILFILALAMASVLTRTEAGWRPVDSFLPALINIAKIVTLFTVAHSITLSLAALGLVSLSSRLVESIIAASVALAAVNNIFPIFRDWTWGVVFLFGLFHGFGFATVLGHLTQLQTALVKTLLAFNVGVEIGQLAIIAVAFPLFFALRNSALYTKGILRVGSAVIVVVALRWFVERAFELG